MARLLHRLRKRYRSFGAHPLARGRALGPFARYVRYHLRRWLPLPPATYPFIGSTKLIGFHEAGVTGNVFHGLHDFEDMGFLLHLLRADDLFVDVGANCGSYTILASGVCGARSIAIEPVPRTFERLQAHVVRNDLSERVETVPAGVGKEAGRLRFSTDRGAMNRVLPEGTAPGQGQEVQVRTLDEIVGAGHPALMKLDVEGFEVEALAGATALLAGEALLALIVELNGSGRAYGHEDAEVDERLRAAGFAPHRYDPRTRTLQPRASWNRDGFNTIYARVDGLASLGERLQGGAAFTARGQTF